MIRITKVHERNPHPRHQARDFEVFLPLRTAERIGVTVLRISEAFGVVEDEGYFLEMRGSVDVGDAVDLFGFSIPMKTIT